MNQMEKKKKKKKKKKAEAGTRGPLTKGRGGKGTRIPVKDFRIEEENLQEGSGKPKKKIAGSCLTILKERIPQEKKSEAVGE